MGDVARKKDRTALMRVLGGLGSSHSDRAFEDPFLHTLVALLISMADEFTDNRFCTVVFDEFFSSGLHKESVCRHLLKLLYYIHHKLPASRLETLMKALQPSPQSVPALGE